MTTPLTVHDVSYQDVAQMIDHSLLRPELTIDEVLAGCATAGKYQVASATLRPCDVSLGVEALLGSGVPVSTVVGFPHGSTTTAVKVYEAKRCIADGAVELDMVLNIGRLRSGDVAFVTDEIGRAHV